MYKPNLQLPLASSYNERGIAGFTNAITNKIDQSKTNCMYEVTKNAITGGGKLDLTKRPGVSDNGSSFGVSSQAAYLICIPYNSTILASPLIFVTNGNDINVCNQTTTKTIFSSASAYKPCFIDKTIISGTENLVLQTARQIGLAHRTWYSGVSGTWTEITDGDFTGFVHVGKMEHMDGFAFQMEYLTNKIFNSDLNSLANWTATNFLTKQINQDFTIGLAKFKNQILGFCQETFEVFYNSGNTTGSPLSPIKQLQQKVGMALMATISSTHYYAVLMNKLFFIGRRAGGSASLGFFSYNGSIVDKVSNIGIDKILNENFASFYGVFAFGFLGHYAVGIQLTITTASPQRWLMYFPDWNDWFEWNSTIFSPVNAGEWFLGVAPNQHKVYNFIASDNWQDAGTNFTASTQFKLPQDGHQRKRMAEFGVLADTARSTNMLSVEFSDDDYQSFYTVGNIDLQRDIKTLNRGGSYRQRAVRLSSTNALETRLSAFVARIE